MSAIGAPLSRVDGPEKVTGRARYAAEFHPDGLVYAATADSTIPAGEITAIDTRRAERAPGVLLVLTHLNADRLPYQAPEERPAVDPVSGNQLRVLDGPQVRFSGQPIAVVVAKTQAQAEYGASLIRATYALDAAARTRFDPALAEPTSEAAAKKNRGPETRKGDAETALSRAPVRIEATYRNGREQHHPMELNATVAQWEGDRLTLWSKSQWVQNERDEIARRFGIPPDRVHVINPYVGGAFGSVLRTWPHVTLAAMAARRFGRPVRLELTRRQMATYVGARGPGRTARPAWGGTRRAAHRHDARGRRPDVDLRGVRRTGAWARRRDLRLPRPADPLQTGSHERQYALPDAGTGLGDWPDRAGDRHGRARYADRARPNRAALAQLRRARPDEGPALDLEAFARMLRAGRRAVRVGPPRAQARTMRDGRDLVGYGMATAIYPAERYPTSASATLFADGHAEVRCATTDMGPGTYTSITQVAADALGLPMTRVRFELGDSSFPKAKEHGGSTTISSVGPAVQAACAALKAKLAVLAAAHGMEAGDGTPLLRRAGMDSLSADGNAEPDESNKKKFAMNGFGAVFAEVRVDPDLFTVRVRRLIGAYDIGRVVNPKLAHSQAIGGMVGGIGMALFEEVEWDDRLGRVVNGTIAEYLVPVNADVHELDALFVEACDDILNPLGTKGGAELGLCGVAPAIANAVWHATGKRVRDLPITPDRLLMA